MHKADSLAHILMAYIKDHRKGILLFALILLIFCVVLFLYHITLEPVLYAALLSLALALLISGLHFLFYFRRQRQLLRLRSYVTISLAELPAAGSELEDNYQALLHLLAQENSALELDKNASISQMVDYYTLWAHQIKVPIAAMQLLLQSDSKADPALALELFKIEQYVEMALCYMRLQNEHGDYLIQEEELDPLIRQAIRKFSRAFINKGLRVDYAGISTKVITDSKWLLFVLEQLLSNAVKYTKQGSIRIYMADEENLVIEDSGIGIPKEDLPRLFEKGFTGFNGRGDKKSTGLGLYLCGRILDNLGHHIKIDSVAGQGTVVTINFARPDYIIE